MRDDGSLESIDSALKLPLTSPGLAAPPPPFPLDNFVFIYFFFFVLSDRREGGEFSSGF